MIHGAELWIGCVVQSERSFCDERRNRKKILQEDSSSKMHRCFKAQFSHDERTALIRLPVPRWRVVWAMRYGQP